MSLEDAVISDVTPNITDDDDNIPKIINFGTYIHVGSYIHYMNNTQDFLDRKISCVINYIDEIKLEKAMDNKLDFYRIPVSCKNIESFIERMDDIINIIYDYASKKKNIYLFIDNNITTAVLIYYLMFYKNLSFIKSEKKVSKIFSDLSTINDFVEAIKSLDDN